MKRGYRLVSGGTDNHLMLVDVIQKGLTGKDCAEALDHAAITVNKNAIPFDTQSPFKAGGIRLGTPAVTTRGMKENEMRLIAGFMDEVLSNIQDKQKIADVRVQVSALTKKFPLYPELIASLQRAQQ